jgi:DNA-binding transcriptional regulator YdaS (Cro superfamily)
MTPIQTAIQEVGGPAEVSRLLDVSVQAVCFWRDGLRQFPADKCPAMEQGVAGRVTCEQMRPDVRWHRIPDPAWPHPEGRPLIDVTRAAAAQEAA